VHRRVIAEFRAWQSGKVVRAAYTTRARRALTPAVQKSVAKTLKALGPLTLATYQISYHKDDDDFYLYTMTCKNGTASMGIGFAHDGEIDFVGFRPLAGDNVQARVDPSPSAAAAASAAPAPSTTTSPLASPAARLESTPKPTPAAVASAASSPPAVATSAPSSAPSTAAPSPKPTAALRITDPPSLLATLADPETRPLLGGPIRQLTQIGWMQGTWNARDIRYRVSGKPAIAANTFVFAYTMKGRWIFGTDGTLTDFIYLSYDPLGERWVLVQLEKYPSYGLWTSTDGWSGGRISFEGEPSSALGRFFRRRFTLIHRGPGRMAIVAEEQRPSGEWITDERIELSKES
jgi:chorismate-pyruvate lyase